MDYAPRMRRVFLFILLPFLLGFSAQSEQKRPSADQILTAAKAEAAQQHKDIFLVFRASWCAPCRQMDDFLEDRETRPILDKYFVIASLNIHERRGQHPELNNPGGEKLADDFGGESRGVPFLVFLDAQGQLLINSIRPVRRNSKGENIGYPATPQEIEWFMIMVKRVVPSLTHAEADTIERWLRRNSGR